MSMLLDDRIVAAQIPQFRGLDNPDEPRAIEIGVGGETLYAEALGFPKSASILLSIYVDGMCEVELSLPLDEAAKLSALIDSRRSQLKETL